MHLAMRSEIREKIYMCNFYNSQYSVYFPFPLLRIHYLLYVVVIYNNNLKPTRIKCLNFDSTMYFSEATNYLHQSGKIKAIPAAYAIIYSLRYYSILLQRRYTSIETIQICSYPICLKYTRKENTKTYSVVVKCVPTYCKNAP